LIGFRLRHKQEVIQYYIMDIDLYLVLGMDFVVVDVESDFGSNMIGQC
jgi:hypothetical protein